MGSMAWLMMILFWTVPVGLVVWAVLTTRSGRPGESPPSALDVLERRLALGEIDRDEFEEKKRLLSRPH